MKRARGPYRMVRLIVIPAFYAGLISMLLVSCSKNSFEGKIIAVELANGAGASVEGAKLILLDPEKPGKTAEVISGSFQSASSPALSHDGRYLFFQGKKEAEDTWQIWMIDLQKKSTLQVTGTDENCTGPVPLPDGTVLFSKSSVIKGAPVRLLYRCNRDGSDLTQITFAPEKNQNLSLLGEGRVLYTSTQQYPGQTTPVLMVMRPDGTKPEIYFGGTPASYPAGKAQESKEGYIYFINNNGALCRVLHRRPLHTFENLSQHIDGKFAAVTPVDQNRCLVSYRPSEAAHYGLYEIIPGSGNAPELLFPGSKDITDPVPVTPMEERPRILPSAVNPKNPTGLLMSQDINHSMFPSHVTVTGDTVADRIRISGLEGELATVEVKADGSFYIKMDADIPVRIETLNSKGETIRGPSDWISLRPNERRACVGCHADPELVPDNIQPLAVKEAPVVVSAIQHNKGNKP